MKKAGIDCAGLIICVLREIGLPNVVPDRTEYSIYRREGVAREEYATFNGVVLEKEMDHLFEPSLIVEAGGIGLFTFMKNRPQHVGFFVDRPGGGINLLHTYLSVGSVVEHIFDSEWEQRLLRTYRIPGVHYG